MGWQPPSNQICLFIPAYRVMGTHKTFEYVVNNLVREQQPFVLEGRPLKWLFGLNNYGEIPAWINRADGDPYDVFVPGYAKRLPFNKEMIATSIIGVLWLENLNHKIAVRVDKPGFDGNLAIKQISQYAQKYQKQVNVNGEWVFYDCNRKIEKPAKFSKKYAKTQSLATRNSR